MTEQLTIAQVALLSAYALGMSAGQLLFKLASPALAQGPLYDRIIALGHSRYFLGAMLLYVALSVVWVWILSFTALSRAYPFVALAFVITPLLGAIVFGEPLSPRLLAGLAVIICGLVLAAG